MGWTFYNSSGEQLIYDAASAVEQATQAEAEAESNVDKYIPPDLIKNSPGVAKVWARWRQSDNVMGASYNMTSMVDGGAAGYSDLTFATDFSSGEYSITGSAEAASIFTMESGSAAAGTLTVRFMNVDGAYNDATHASVAIFGDQ